jgi:hypothetical protein
MMRYLVMTVLMVGFSVGSFAQHSDGSQKSPYSGEQVRSIKSLSPEDIAELRRGGGSGLAKAAELNGIPGPAHLLELKEKIPLSAGQVAEISEIYAAMLAQAIAEGERLIELEQKLEERFRSGAMTDAALRHLLTDIAVSQQKLRYIHLSTHLRTPRILSKVQIARYNALRGYSTDPCDQVPEGHDPEMWRKHNSCD